MRPDAVGRDVLREAGIEYDQSGVYGEGWISVRRTDAERLIAERDEARALTNRWIAAALYATPVTTDAFDPMNPEAFAESRRHAVDEAIVNAGRKSAGHSNSVDALELLGAVWLQKWTVKPTPLGFAVEDSEGTTLGFAATPISALLQAYDLLRGEAEDTTALRDNRRPSPSPDSGSPTADSAVVAPCQHCGEAGEDSFRACCMTCATLVCMACTEDGAETCACCRANSELRQAAAVVLEFAENGGDWHDAADGVGSQWTLTVRENEGWDAALDRLRSALAPRTLPRRREVPFQWQCPRCGALHQSTTEHCPCEAERPSVGGGE